MAGPTKQCRKCGKTKALSEYPKHPMMADGHLHACKVCIKAYKAEHYRRNREQVKERVRSDYQKKREQKLAQSRTRYRTDAAYRERIRRHHQQYAERYPEKIAEKARQQYLRMKSAQPEYFMEQQRRARVRDKGLRHLELTLQEWLDILAQYQYRCAYCGSSEQITMDHQLPVQRGGRHSKDNVVPACRRCNASKADLTVAEWLAAGGFGRRSRKRKH